MRSFSELVLRGTQVVLSLTGNAPVATRGTYATCPIDGPTSCQKSNVLFLRDDSCCLNYPGGQFSQTQFWNSDARRGPKGYLGPAKSWTIHGLWPDHCDGKYDSVCDCNRSGDCSSSNRKCSSVCNKDYSSIEAIMRKFGQLELLDYMNQYWKGISGDEDLHQHEWSKHGTCINTLEPKCYDGYVAAQEVVDYFRVAVDLFKTLPTYQWLESAGITPDAHKTYKRDDVLAALKAPRNASVVIGCERGELREVWYFYTIRGSLQSGQFVNSDPDFSGTGGKAGKYCPETFKWLPKDEA